MVRSRLRQGRLKQKSERKTNKSRAGCSCSSAASEEVSRPVAMAARRSNKHKTKSVPAKLPWQLSERASARLSWRVSFRFSYCDLGSPGQQQVAAAGFHPSPELQARMT